MATGEGPLPGDPELSRAQRGLLFTGEAVDSLNPGQLEALATYALRVHGVEMRVVDDVRELGRVALADAEQEPEPMPATREDFRAFAAAHGFRMIVAGKAWAWVEDMAGTQSSRPDSTEGGAELPRVVVRGPEVDLWSIYRYAYEALQATPRYYSGQRLTFSGGVKRDEFLITLLNEKLRPALPLPPSMGMRAPSSRRQ